jgi:hypothetical protein
MLALWVTFGDALLQAHRALLGDLRALREEVVSGGPGGVAAGLDAVRTALEKHFRFEEENGYLDSVVERQPHLGRAVERLHEQHRRLLGALDALRAEADGAKGLTEGLRERVEGWIAEVRRHERSENLLVQDAFLLELGTED